MAYTTTPHVRARLRAARKERGLDVARMAQELRAAAEYPHGMPSAVSIQRNIERWEAGKVTRISERYRMLYARALNVPEDELFHSSPSTPPRPEAREGDVDAIHTMLTALMTSDRQFGGQQMLQQAAGYLTAVIEPRLSGSASAPMRRHLFSVSTEFTMRLAAMYLDADQAAQALALLGRAASMANESQDISLTAWVLARRGEHELHQAALTKLPTQRAGCIDQAIAYTEGSIGVARSAPPMTRAFLATKSALAWSMTRQRAQTQRQLRAVWDAYEEMGGAEEPGWMGPYGREHLHHEEARCYVNLGMGRDAVRAAEQALTVRRAGRPRAFTLGVLAIGHAQSLNVEQAVLAGHELVELAQQISSRRVTVRVGEVLDSLAPYKTQPAVASLHEAAAAMLTGSNR